MRREFIELRQNTRNNRTIVLAAHSLACERGERLLFKDLSFTLKRGEVLQVVGANGAGKSSLLKILAGLNLPLAGTITWQNNDIIEDPASYRAAVCYLGHANGIKAGLTVTENIDFASCLQKPNSRNQQEAIKQLGLADYAEVLVEQLSAGQQRRVALAQLLVSPASLWILDEPFTSLDKQTVEMLEQSLAEHCHRGGLVVIATHQSLKRADFAITTCELS